jgi:hypothetical protein
MSPHAEAISETKFVRAHGAPSLGVRYQTPNIVEFKIMSDCFSIGSSDVQNASTSHSLICFLTLYAFLEMPKYARLCLMSAPVGSFPKSLSLLFMREEKVFFL